MEFIRKVLSVVQFLILCTLMESDFCYSQKPIILALKANQTPTRLRFHHDVALTVSVTVGSPPQQATMVLDTGSELPWLNCNKTKPNKFDPSRSTSYSPVACSTATCKTRTRDFVLPVTCQSNLCHAIISYADSTSVEGNLATDNLAVTGSALPGIVFGCMDKGSSSNPAQDDKTTGLIGLNRGSLSLVSQLNVPKFSYCISGRDDSGLLILGAADIKIPATLSYTPLVQKKDRLPSFDRFAYTVNLAGIKVANTVLPIPASALVPDHTGAGQTMVDSGTQFTFLLGEAYNALKKEFTKQTASSLKLLNEPNFVFQGAMDLCFRVGSGLPALPAVTLMFGGAELKVSGGDLLYKVDGQRRGADSVYCLTFGNSDLLGASAYIIGHHHQKNKWVEFDLAGNRLGLVEVDCGSVSQRADFSRFG